MRFYPYKIPKSSIQALTHFFYLLPALSLFLTACHKYTFTPAPANPPGFYDQVNSGIVYNGNLVIVGNFNTIYGGGHNIAQWNGTSWQPLGKGIGGNFYKTNYLLSVYNGKLIVGGIDSADGIAVNGLAQWNGSSWQSLGTGIKYDTNSLGLANIYAMTIYNGNLVVGGYFRYAGGIQANNIAQWDGSSWASVGTATNLGTGPIDALTVYGGNLVAGGNVGFGSMAYLAQWNGSSWSLLGGVCNYFVEFLATCNGDLIATGEFTDIGSVFTNENAAIWNGTSWQAVNSPLWQHSSFFTFSNWGSEYIGLKDNLWAWPIPNSAAIVGTCNTDKINYYTAYITPNINPLCAYNGSLICGGWFTTVNGVQCNLNLARWTGSSWQSFP